MKLKDRNYGRYSVYDVKTWDRYKYLIDNEFNYDVMPIDAHIGERYAFDLFGLFRNYFEIPEHYIYIHMLLNGYKTYSDYDGNKLSFKIIKDDALARADLLRDESM